MNDKYLILLEQKYSNIPSNWSVEYFNQSYDDAFAKLVALETLKNKDDDNKVYYVVNQNHLWTKSSDVKIDSKIKTAQEPKQQVLL